MGQTRRYDVVVIGGGSTGLEASRAAVAATGTSAALPPIDAIDEVGTWNSRDVTAADQVPARLLVLGGAWSERRWARRSGGRARKR